MLEENAKNDLEKLAISYFTDELGIESGEIPVASSNLVGIFDVLLRIDERLKAPVQTAQPL
jgi:hypothetical protein